MDDHLNNDRRLVFVKRFCFGISAVVNMKLKNNYEINFKNI
ncbi:hypothetical protein J2787_004021 [Chryseobacterium rhizosphaerae]|uniref:Uncharacterized protein n=1 Tax=Chryseobacterium rhizosphaerae TaxID=395937 RepID=A0AAE3YE01_9FLAO|nr:hypothetical protein [Chryseobacterium rhizosphaerae]MDR6547396.1 hypothetical protein [Chryseobacterium rhizosphaerae]SMC99655.1 hypothetical protein SAMN02787074_4338 [Chryseobacterium sp. YR221]